MQRILFTIMFVDTDLVHTIENSCGKEGGEISFQILARARDTEQLTLSSFCTAQLCRGRRSRLGSGDKVVHLHGSGALQPIRTRPRPWLPLVINFFLAVSLTSNFWTSDSPTCQLRNAYTPFLAFN